MDVISMNHVDEEGKEVVKKAKVRKSTFTRLKDWKDYASRERGKKVSWSALIDELLDDVENMSEILQDSKKLERRLEDMKLGLLED